MDFVFFCCFYSHIIVIRVIIVILPSHITEIFRAKCKVNQKKICFPTKKSDW